MGSVGFLINFYVFLSACSCDPHWEYSTHTSKFLNSLALCSLLVNESDYPSTFNKQPHRASCDFFLLEHYIDIVLCPHSALYCVTILLSSCQSVISINFRFRLIPNPDNGIARLEAPLPTLFNRKLFLEFCRKLARLLVDINVTYNFQKLPSRIGSSHEAQQLILRASELRTTYLTKKADSLYRLQKLLDEVKWIDNKILEVDIHMGRIYHVVDRSGFGIPPPVVARQTGQFVVEGCV